MRKSWLAVGLVAALASVGVALPGQAAPRLVASGSTSCGEGTVSWSPAALWPPNHKFQAVTISYRETDGEPNETLSLSVNQSTVTESDLGRPGSGGPTHDPDWTAGSSTSGTDGGASATFVENVRAERSGTDGNGGGRLYTIPVRCNDSVGGVMEPGGGGMAMVTVCVPHDMSAASRQFCVANVP